MMMMVLMNITLMTFYPHYDTRKRQRGVMSDWVSMISKIIEECPATAHWLVTFLSRCLTWPSRDRAIFLIYIHVLVTYPFVSAMAYVTSSRTCLRAAQEMFARAFLICWRGPSPLR